MWQVRHFDGNRRRPWRTLLEGTATEARKRYGRERQKRRDGILLLVRADGKPEAFQRCRP